MTTTRRILAALLVGCTISAGLGVFLFTLKLSLDYILTTPPLPAWVMIAGMLVVVAMGASFVAYFDITKHGEKK
jgi:hypothetical protein